MLNVLRTGEGVLKKRTKHGFYIDMPYQKNIFIHYSEFLNESIFDEIDEMHQGKSISISSEQIKDNDADNPA